VLLEDTSEGLVEIAQQVKAVGHLDRLRRTPARSIGVGSGSIASNKFHPRMLTQPGDDRLGFSIGQELDGLAPLKVDQDRAVALTFQLGIKLSRPVTEPARLQNRA
jgi:hypothetical protein